METEEKRHEKEESLILEQFGTSHNIPHKLQNGGQFSEGNSLQITGDKNWSHYKPSTDANTLKRHRENCNNPASEQGLLDQGSYIMNGELMNGELKHALTEQSLLVHQSKKTKIDSEIKGKDDINSDLLEKFPELTTTNEFGCNSQTSDIKFDSRNCNFRNRDIFCVPRNKQVPNGAVSSPSTIESTPGDLLEKTLSQYYPEQVSIALQTSGSQLDAVNNSLPDKLSSEGAQLPPMTSGLPNSAQMPGSQQQQAQASGNTEGGNNYNSVNYVLNGYSNNFGADDQQTQQHQQSTSSYSGEELALGQLSGMILSTNNAKIPQQHPNGAQCYQDDTRHQGVYVKAHQEFNGSSFPNCNSSLQPAEAEYESFPSSGTQKLGHGEENTSSQHLQHGTDRDRHYGIQTQNFQENAVNPLRAESQGPMGSRLQQLHHTGIENGMENTSQQRANLSCSTPNQRGWRELNSSHSQQPPTSGPSSQAQEQDLWRNFSTKSMSEQQTANPPDHDQMFEPNPMQRFQTQRVFSDGSQGSNFQKKQQDYLPMQTHCASAQHNTASEWQQSNSEGAQMQPSLAQKMPEQQNFTQNQQVDSRCQSQMQSERLCEDNDLQEILSPGFLATQQQQHCQLQRPMSQPPQFEAQQLKSPSYRPHSQPQPGQQLLQSNQPFGNGPAQSSNQHVQQNDHATFSNINTVEMSQHQRQYPPNSGSTNLKQFQPQQPKSHCHQPNHVDFPPNSTQSQPHLPQGALSQQVTKQMYPKAEQQLKTSCTQFQRGPQLPLGPAGPHVDFQRHAALRMHLLQKQERQGSPQTPQNSSDPKHIQRAVKMENGPRLEISGLQNQEHQIHMREAGRIQIKQENQQSLCEQSKKQASIIASMEQSLRQYQLSPVFEKKSIVINALNKVKVESSGPVTILSTKTDVNGVESSALASSTEVLKKTPDSTPKKEQLLQSFMDSPVKLLNTPIKNLLDTPMKTQYDIASCHCVGKSLKFSLKQDGPVVLYILICFAL